MVDQPDTPSEPGDGDTYLPIAIGFYLLSLPLWISVLLADTAAGKLTNGIAAAVMVALGALLHWRTR